MDEVHHQAQSCFNNESIVVNLYAKILSAPPFAPSGHPAPVVPI